MRASHISLGRLPANARPQPSLVDRLTAAVPESTAAFDLNLLVDSVRRDLEALLNTRRSVTADAEAFPEVAESIVTYGLPDLSLVSAATQSERGEIGRIVEGVIARYEPRLRDVRANLVDAPGGRDQTVMFHIHAKLAVDPSPEIGFETVLELMTGHTSVKPSEGA